MNKTCISCNQSYPLANYYINKSYKDGKSAYCKPCHAVVERNNRVKRLYGVDEKFYVELSTKQNFLCAICSLPAVDKKTGQPKRLCIDHNHNTGKIRGLLCGPCNMALGLLANKQNVLSAIRYLEDAGE